MANLRPDALAVYRVGHRLLHFWLEWDCGTMNVRYLFNKFASYAHFIASREWAREEVRVLRLSCIAPDIAQAKRIQRVRHERLEQTPGLVMCTNTEVLLNEHGPPAPIWLLFTAGRAQGVVPGSAHRFGWSTLIPQANAM